MKEAILIGSFGTTHEDAHESSVRVLKNQVRAAFPNHDVFSAYTSSRVRRALQKRGKEVLSPEEALERIAGEGYSSVIVLPTHITAGFEYEKLERAIGPFRSRLEKAVLAKPLLYTREDIALVLRAVIAENPLGENEGLLLMGHGTAHPSNAMYKECNDLIAEQKLGPVFVGTVEAEPELSDALDFFRGTKVSKLLLAPFLFVAGDHAKEDLAGEDESWLCAVREAGYEARAHVKGLGEYESVRALYLKHLEDVL